MTWGPSEPRGKHARAAPGSRDLTRPITAKSVLAGAVIAATTVLTLTRLTPIGNGDFFSFVSVAERIRAGDRLYAEVWDNKDPYFYYVLSLVGNIGGWGYFLLELLWVGLAVVGLFSLARTQGLSRGWATVIAWGVAPWCLLGVSYAGTMSVMPGVALTLGALALAAQRRWAAAGAVLGVLLLLKITLVPVAVAGVAVFAADERARAWISTMLAGVISASAGLAVLALRGELLPYLAMVKRNSEYADRMVEGNALSGFFDHLSLVFAAGAYPGERIAFASIIVGVALAAWLCRKKPSKLLLCSVVVMVSSVLVLGLTGVWPHHAQLLAVPACLTLLALCENGLPRLSERHLAAIPACLVAAYLLGGATPLGQIVIKPATAAQPLQQLGGVSAEAESITSDTGVKTYTRLGRNDRSAHARGLDELELACRDFQQYPFDPETTFARTLECLPRSDVVFVADNFADQSEPPDYVRFSTQARSILDNHFTCSAAHYGQKCLRDVR